MDNESIAYVELLGLTLSGKDAPTDGLYWTDLEGWWGLSDLKGESHGIPGGPGKFKRVLLYRDSRVITLVGHILTGSVYELAEVRARLEAALAPGVGRMTVVTSSYGRWHREVEIESLNVDPDHGRGYVKFTVDMIANDPNRYSDTKHLGPVGLPQKVGGLYLPESFPWNFGLGRVQSRLILDNTGTATVWPRVYITGGFSSVTVLDITAGRRVTYAVPVPQGKTLLIDNFNSQALIDGVSFTLNLSERSWFSVPQKESHIFEFRVTSPVGEPEMSIEYEIGAP